MKNKQYISILGAGESGVGAALLAQHVGYEVFVSDGGTIQLKYKDILTQAGIAFEEGGHTSDLILKGKEMIKSPGIDPKKSEICKQAKKEKVKIIGEIEFAARYTKAKKVGITGTNGKTTTTLLTYHLLKKGGLNVRLAGNVGNSFAAQVLEEIKNPKQSDNLIYVLELSSFMLDNMYDFKADLAVMTNITPDHLDRYDYKLEKYVDSKFRIIQNMDANGYFIYGIDSPLIEERLIDVETDAIELPFSLYPDEFDGACGDEEYITIQLNGEESEIQLKNSVLQGKHNLYNTMAAALVAKVMGVSNQTIENGLSDFENHPHRMQVCGTINGIQFINDSKATNVDSAWYALDAIKEPMIWIAGGVDKGNDYTELYPVIENKVKALICLGKENDKLKEAFQTKIKIIKETQSVAECIQFCLELGNKGDIALLSPCCASFDLFKNYEDRGNQFMNEVGKLMSV